MIRLCSLILLAATFFSTLVTAVPLDNEENSNGGRHHLHMKCGHDYCKGTKNTDDPKYICGDSRLGPEKLPGPGFDPLDDLVDHYRRFGGLCPGEFLDKWWDGSGLMPGWRYPPRDGFQLSVVGTPIQGTQTLRVGSLLDRFGGETGRFLSPAGAPYSQRALPPSNLDWPSGRHPVPYNYHVYKVIREFDVLSGPVASWFGQPGQGTQYQTTKDVATLIREGYLMAVPPYWGQEH